MFALFLKGGLIMYLLGLISVIGLYIVIQKIIFIKWNSVDKKVFVEHVKEKLSSKGLDKTIQDIRLDRKLMVSSLQVLLKTIHLPDDETQKSVEKYNEGIVLKLNKNLKFLSSIITVAPILGLLGTVLGLMDIFNVISGGGLGDASVLSGGIAEALITTVTGLTITIPLVFCNDYINDRIESFMVSTDQLLSEVLAFYDINMRIKS